MRLPDDSVGPQSLQLMNGLLEVERDMENTCCKYGSISSKAIIPAWFADSVSVTQLDRETRLNMSGKVL